MKKAKNVEILHTHTRGNLRNKKGITLIALVITIIILLILAGVAINFVLGDNGLILKARTAKTNYETEAKKEENTLAKMDEVIENSRDNWKEKYDELLKKYNELLSENEDSKIVDNLTLAITNSNSWTTRTTSSSLSFNVEPDTTYYILCFYVCTGGLSPYKGLIYWTNLEKVENDKTIAQNVKFSDNITVIEQIGQFIKIKTNEETSATVTMTNTGVGYDKAYTGRLWLYAYK